ncbi:hypothetical protein BJ170DRAFT_403300 [Xylariales sp. AK1849]|nr:hypothetical protein BJ170DRAFT_403300 [Xylariales sp. AK1849]
MSHHENRQRTVNTRWPILPDHEDTFDDLDFHAENETNLSWAGGESTYMDRAGRYVSFKAGAPYSRSSDSEEGNGIVVGIRQANFLDGTFGERNWSRSTDKWKYDRPTVNSAVGWSKDYSPYPSHPKDQYHDHERVPRVRSKPIRRPAGDGRPILGHHEPRRGTPGPPGQQGAAASGRGRGRYASSGTQTTSEANSSSVPESTGSQPKQKPDQSSAVSGPAAPGIASRPGQQTSATQDVLPPMSGAEAATKSPPQAAGSSQPSRADGQEPQTSARSDAVKQPTTVPGTRVPPGHETAPLPQPIVPAAGPPSGPPAIGSVDAKLAAADASAAPASTLATDPVTAAAPVADPTTIPSNNNPKMPTVAAPTPLPLASLYMLAPAGHDNHVRNPLSGMSTGSVPTDHVVYTKEDGESHGFLVLSGPMLFQAAFDPTAAGDQVFELATNDKLREDFTFAWQPSKENGASAEDAPLSLQGFSVAVRSQANRFFEITNLEMKISKDATDSALIFSTSAEVLNEEFEVGFTHSSVAPTTVAAEASTDTGATPAVTSLSGIRRYPGQLMFGLKSGAADGGFKTLGDLCPLAGLSPKPWLKTLLKATTVTFGRLAGTSARNAVWYLPSSGSQCCVRLEAAVGLNDGIVKQLDKYISGWKEDLPYISAIVRRSVVSTSGPWGNAFVEGEMVIAVEPKSVDSVPHGLGAYVSFGEDEVRLMLVCYSTKLQWTFLKKWLLSCCAEVDHAISKLEGTLASVREDSTKTDSSGTQGPTERLDHILWRKVTVTLGHDSTTNRMALVRLDLQLEANFQFLVPTGKNAVFAMDFSWKRGSGEFSGECAFNGSGPLLGAGDPPLQYRCDYERWNILPYLVPSEPYMSIRSISNSVSEHLPFGVPTEILVADLFVSNKSIKLHGELAAILGKPAVSSSASLEIDYATMDIEVNVNFAEKPKKLDATITGAVALLPYREGDPDATLEASIRYASEKNALSFRAAAANVPMTALHTLFPEGEEREHAMSILENIRLRTISLSIEHSDGSDTSIDFNGAIEISQIILITNFNRRGSGNWNLTAGLEKQVANAGASPKEIDLGEAVGKLLGPSIVEILPGFVTKTKLKRNDPANDKFEVVCLRISKPDYLVFGAELKFGMLHVQFAQIVPVPSSASKGSTAAKDAKALVKRLIRVSVGPLPSVPRLPVVGDLDIPFDTLEFLWASATITKNEVDVLNGNVEMFTKQAIALGQEQTELLQGSHFRLVSSGNVFLDHLFDNGSRTSQAAGQGSTSADERATGVTASSLTSSARVSSGDSAAAAATTAPLSKKKGPVTLSGVALSYEGGKLRIHLDASVLIGPIAAGVQGLNLFMDVGRVDGLHNLLHAPLEVQIEGFDMSFDRSPVMLAGALYHKPGTKAYYGGIAISLKKLSIAALGMYSQIDAQPSPPTPAYDSFFVYGMMEGLIFTVGWAEIRGLIAGFGYNSRLRLPTVDQITTFPLVQGFSTPGGFSMDQAITSLTGPDSFMTPSKGSLWMALGLIIRACEAIDMKAVATLALGPDQTEIGLVARATATLPRGSSADDALILIDLSVVGKLDLIHGELAVDGLINPTSFILNKNCRPSGGFSIRTWFSNSPYEGDWVVSFGGYHPLYKVPSHYPVPPRLGITWNLGDNLRVTGNAYAAVTPGAIMAGGLLQAVFSAGPIGAHFDAHADFLVNLKPLHYQADMAISAGVYYEIRVWLVRKKISVNIGATLHLEGPPIHGQVHFDLCVVSFNVSFGSGRAEGVRAIKLWELMDLVLQDAAKNKNGNTINNPHTLTVVSGLLGDGTQKETTAIKDASKKDPWVVRSDNFLFQVRSAVPVTNAVIESDGGSGASYAGRSIISRPMHMKEGNRGITSPMNVKVRRAGTKEVLPFKAVSRIDDKLPANYWGRYSENPGDYMRPDPKTMPSSIDHLVGMTVTPPPPKRSEKSMPAFKPVADAFRAGPWQPGSVPKKATRFVDDDDARDSVKWSRVRAAMSTKARGKQTKLGREDIVKSFIDIAHPGTDAQTKKVHDAYRRIGASVPSVVLDDPARFYISPPTVFCN